MTQLPFDCAASVVDGVRLPLLILGRGATVLRPEHMPIQVLHAYDIGIAI
jgi:hypothetical protein